MKPEEKEILQTKINDIIRENKNKKYKIKNICVIIILFFLMILLLIIMTVWMILKPLEKNPVEEEVTNKINNTNLILNTTNATNTTNITNVTIGRNVSSSYEIAPDVLLTVSNSQLLEDIILFGFLYDVKNGFYIDVGANDPTKDSITKMFYIRGWNGINIQTKENIYQMLQSERTRDINLNVLVKDKKGNKDDLIQVETMSDICQKYIPNNTEIQFCRIGVEQGDKEILLGFDFIHYRPKIFCIESTISFTNISSNQTIDDILCMNNYTFALQYSVNRYYVDNRANYLTKRINLVNSMIDLYKSHNLK